MSRKTSQQHRNTAIRPIAICVFFDGDRIFVGEGVDHAKGETFYRPLGGAIEFGEYGRQAVARELREEIGAEIVNLHLLETLENIFTYEGETGHEIVQVYTADFADPVFYELDVVCGAEDDGTPFRGVWKPLADFTERGDILYPDGLLKVLLEWLDTVRMLQQHAQPAHDSPLGLDWAAALKEIRGE